MLCPDRAASQWRCELHSSEGCGAAERRAGKVLLGTSDTEGQLNKRMNSTREKSHPSALSQRQVSFRCCSSAHLIYPAGSVLWGRVASKGAPAPSSEAAGFVLHQNNIRFTRLRGENRNTAHASFEGWEVYLSCPGGKGLQHWAAKAHRKIRAKGWSPFACIKQRLSVLLAKGLSS